MRLSNNILRVVIFSGTLGLCACQTISMPKLDLIKSAEFSEDAANIPSSYPNVIDAPAAPDDVRSADQWDRDAKTLQKLRDSSQRAQLEPPLTKDETTRAFQELKDKAQAYKLDDLADSIDEDYPPSNLQRRRN